MSLPWYHLERPTRLVLLRCYYAVCAFSYPAYAALNFNDFIPSRAEVLTGRGLRESIVNPQGIKK